MQNFEFSKLRVRSFSPDSNEFSWKVANTFLDPYDYTWVIQRSESPLGPWDEISGAFQDKYLFFDGRVNIYNRHRYYYYRIKSVSVSDPANVVFSHAVTLTAEPDLIAQEIQLLEQTLWREFSGRECYLFPARTFGQYCPHCTESPGKGSTYRKVRSQCLTCYDTGFARGFLDPIRVFTQIDPTQKSIQMPSTGELQIVQTTARMGGFPIVKPRDIIVEAENKRWRVITAGGTERLRHIVHQELTLFSLEPHDIEFRLPLNFENIQNLEPSPLRNFTNPQDLESAEGDAMSATLTVYGYAERN